MKLRLLLILSFLSISLAVSAQRLTGISTQWSDSFREWIIYTDNEELQGELRLRMMSADDWRQWEYRIGENTGTIRAKWPDRYDEWEVRGDNVVATARAIWRDDPREWRLIGQGGRLLTWKSRYGNILEEWILLTDENEGTFEMYTAYEGDPRDWVVIDEAALSLPEAMLLVFVTVFNSTPKQ